MRLTILTVYQRIHRDKKYQINQQQYSKHMHSIFSHCMHKSDGILNHYTKREYIVLNANKLTCCFI